MATDPLQSGAFGFANGGPVADPFDFSGIAPTPQTTAENLQDPYDFSGIPTTPYQPPVRTPVSLDPSVAPGPPAPDSAYEQPVIAPYVPPFVIGGRTPDNPNNPDPTDPDDPYKPPPTDPPTTDTSWWKDHLPGFTFDSSTGALSVAEGEDVQSRLARAYMEYYEMTNLPRGELGGGNYIDRVEEQDEAGDSYYIYTLRHDPDWRSNTGTTGGGTTGGGTTGGGTTGGGTTGGGTTGGGTTGGTTGGVMVPEDTPGGTTAAEWMNRLPQGLRYSGGRLEIDPAYSTGDPSGRRYGWSYSENAERDVFNPQDYLASIWSRMYGRRKGDIPALGGGYGISRETMEDDGGSWDEYSITGPNMAGGGMIRGPSYLSGGIGSLGSTYLR